MDVLINREQETTRVIFHADEGAEAFSWLGKLATTEHWPPVAVEEYSMHNGDEEALELGLAITLSGIIGRRDLFRLGRVVPDSLPSTEQVVREAMQDVHLPD